jgi:NADH dehydrogenase FAD-containing subunit
MRQALTTQGIHMIEQQRVTAVTANAVILTERQLTADVIIWAGGFVASPLARAAGIQVNERNQLLTDPFLRSLSYKTIYAVGDMAFPVAEPGAPMRMSLFAALVSGAQAADNIETFQQYRQLLFSIAYRMMGTVTEAEDILQDAYLRWQAQPLAAIHDPKYYLTTIVTRLCLNQLSSARNQRETYLGPWLP